MRRILIGSSNKQTYLAYHNQPQLYSTDNFWSSKKSRGIYFSSKIWGKPPYTINLIYGLVKFTSLKPSPTELSI
uniref:Uncharacterized protein n=1 Tax=Megaselia scalaris TaxID=36166 RepID=T1H3W1_MEGSC